MIHITTQVYHSDDRDRSHYHQFSISFTGNRLPYEVHLTNLNEGTYVISIVIHIGACADNDEQTITDGDYYNEDMEEFTIDDNTNDIEKDISVVKLEHSEGMIIFITLNNLYPLKEVAALNATIRNRNTIFVTVRIITWFSDLRISRFILPVPEFFVPPQN